LRAILLRRRLHFRRHRRSSILTGRDYREQVTPYGKKGF
jgi:hypothetical protein